MAIDAIGQQASSYYDRLGQFQASAQGFDSILTKASGATAEAGRTNKQKLRHACEQLVSDALVQPLLKQMRQSPFKVKMFHGGHAEQAFAQKLDTILADRIVHSANFPIVDSVYNNLSRHPGGLPTSTGAAVGGRLNTHG